MRPRIITSTLVVVIIALQLVSLLAVNQSTQAGLLDQAKLSVIHQIETKAKRLVIQTQQFLAPIESQLSISRQLIADGLLDASDTKSLELYFLSQLRSNLAMKAMYLGHEDGSFVAVSRSDTSLLENYGKPVLRAKVVSNTAGQQKTVWHEYSLIGKFLNSWVEGTATYDGRVGSWYRSAQSHDRAVWTDAYSIEGGDSRAIAASVKLRDVEGADSGVLGVSVSLSQMNALVSAVPVSNLGSAVILDSNLNEIAVFDPYDSKVSNVGVSTMDSASSEHEQKQKLNKSFYPFNITDKQLAPEDQHWFSEDGRQVFVQRRIYLFDGALKWQLLMQMPIEELQRSRPALDGNSYRTMGVIIIPGVLAILIIISLSEPLRRLYSRATIDYLTRAYNREEFMRRFTRRLQYATTDVRWVGVVMDLDGFKQINDQYGHDAGDDILKAVVARLQQRIGMSGFVGRLGGDEFAVALKLQPGETDNVAVERLRHHVVKDPVKSARGLHRIGITAGVALAQRDEPIAALLERADGALIAGKAIAKNSTYRSVDQKLYESNMSFQRGDMMTSAQPDEIGS